MPPSRSQSQSHKDTTHHRPYSKGRDRNRPPHESREASLAEKSAAPSSDAMDPASELKKEKRRRKKSASASQTKLTGALPSSETMDVDQIPTRVKPLQTAGGNTNVAQPQTQADKTTTNASRVQKLEQKIERQRSRLKEAEARLTKTEENSKRDAERILALEAKVKEQEDALKTKEEEAAGQKQRADDSAKTIEGHLADKEQVQETLQEAVSCMICSDTLRDPHILSCGHTACRDCLQSWFRQPNAYLHDVGEPITPDRDLSFRSKVCHVCRTTVIRRPTRMYNLYSFLEPLGIVPNIPTVSQETGDPWDKTFPAEKASYKLYDDEDDTTRCPQCLHEVYDSACDQCGAEFSDDDGTEDDYDAAMFDSNSDQDGPGRAAGRRRAQVDIATIEEVLGDSADDGIPPVRRGRLHTARQRLNADDDDDDSDIDFSDSDDSAVEAHFARRTARRNRARAERAARGGRPQLQELAAVEESNDEDVSFESDATHGYPYEAGSGTEDEYDGAVPRVLPAGGPIDDDDEEMDDEDEESAYGGSFIVDEEEEEGYDLESTGSLHDEEDEADASDGLGVDVGEAEEEEEEEEEEAGGQPNLGQLRRMRLQRLAESRRRPSARGAT